MNKIVKRLLTVLTASVILVGAYTGYQAVEGHLDAKMAVERGKTEQIQVDFDDYKVEAEERLEELSEEVERLTAVKLNLVTKIDATTVEIQQVNTTIADLQSVAVTLTGVNDKLYNANLQIQEYKKIVNMYESRFNTCKMTIITQEEIIKRCIKAAQEFEQLYLKQVDLSEAFKARLGATERRLLWEKTKFKGSAIVLAAAAGVALWGAVT